MGKSAGTTAAQHQSNLSSRKVSRQPFVVARSLPAEMKMPASSTLGQQVSSEIQFLQPTDCSLRPFYIAVKQYQGMASLRMFRFL